MLWGSGAPTRPRYIRGMFSSYRRIRLGGFNDLIVTQSAGGRKRRDREKFPGGVKVSGELLLSEFRGQFRSISCCRKHINTSHHGRRAKRSSTSSFSSLRLFTREGRSNYISKVYVRLLSDLQALAPLTGVGSRWPRSGPDPLESRCKW